VTDVGLANLTYSITD
jgi:hypothetical protein